VRSRNQKPPSMSAKLKLKKFRDTKDTTVAKDNRKLTPAEVKKLFKNWR